MTCKKGLSQPLHSEPTVLPGSPFLVCTWCHSWSLGHALLLPTSGPSHLFFFAWKIHPLPARHHLVICQVQLHNKLALYPLSRSFFLSFLPFSTIVILYLWKHLLYAYLSCFSRLPRKSRLSIMAGPSNWRRAWYNRGLNKRKGIDDMERTWHLVGIFSYFPLSPDPRADPTPCIQADDVASEF